MAACWVILLLFLFRCYRFRRSRVVLWVHTYCCITTSDFFLLGRRGEGLRASLTISAVLLPCHHNDSSECRWRSCNLLMWWVVPVCSWELILWYMTWEQIVWLRRLCLTCLRQALKIVQRTLGSRVLSRWRLVGRFCWEGRVDEVYVMTWNAIMVVLPVTVRRIPFGL